MKFPGLWLFSRAETTLQIFNDFLRHGLTQAVGKSCSDVPFSAAARAVWWCTLHHSPQ